jgi:hypothetical protein
MNLVSKLILHCWVYRQRMQGLCTLTPHNHKSFTIYTYISKMYRSLQAFELLNFHTLYS